MRLFCVVGEVSGDAIAAKVVQGLRRHGVAVELFGIGGWAAFPVPVVPAPAYSTLGRPSLRKEGLARTEVPLEWLSVMGIAEVVPALPRIWVRSGPPLRRSGSPYLRHCFLCQAAFGKTVDAFHRCRPDVILSVDCKGFSSRVLRRIARGASKPSTHHSGPPPRARGQ